MTGISQEEYRSFIGGDPDNDYVTVGQMNDAIETKTGRKYNVLRDLTLPKDEVRAKQLAIRMNSGSLVRRSVLKMNILRSA